jgi:hypothetical protein
MKISIAIMAHPNRAEFIPYLQGKIGTFPVSVPVAMDDGCGIWENAKRAWRMFDPMADYHIVIQDDAIICNDFLARAIAEIEAHPKHAFSFYFGNRVRFQATAEKAVRQNGIAMNWLSWGVAVCLPTKVIPAMISFCDLLPPRYAKHDDTKIAKFLESIKMPVWYPMPSLVDHRDIKSLVASDPAGGRKAYKFIDS